MKHFKSIPQMIGDDCRLFALIDFAIICFVCGQSLFQTYSASNEEAKLSFPASLSYLCSLMVYLTRVEHFNAAHKLYNPQWSKEKNKEVFGVCANENWHGHNFNLHITLKGEPDADTGFLMDAKHLSAIVNEHVIEKLDHKNLNLDVDFLHNKMCTTEVLAVAIWQQLSPHFRGNAKLHCVKLFETPKIYVEYFGD